MNEKKTPIQLALKWGLINLICSIVLSLITFNLGFSLFLPFLILILILVIYITCMVIPIKEFRKQEEGFITFQEAFTISIAVVGISAIMGAVFSSVYLNYIDPAYLERMADGMQEWADKQGLGNSPEMEQAVEDIRQGKNQGFLRTILQSLIVGGIISLIVSAIMQKKKPVF